MVATNFFHETSNPLSHKGLRHVSFFVFSLRGQISPAFDFDIIKNEILYLIVGKTAT
jgi:hypothetical protein